MSLVTDQIITAAANNTGPSLPAVPTTINNWSEVSTVNSTLYGVATHATLSIVGIGQRVILSRTFAGIHYSDDDMATWTSTSIGTAANSGSANFPKMQVFGTTIVGRTNTNKLLISTDQGATWSDVSPAFNSFSGGTVVSGFDVAGSYCYVWYQNAVATPYALKIGRTTDFVNYTDITSWWVSGQQPHMAGAGYNGSYYFLTGNLGTTQSGRAYYGSNGTNWTNLGISGLTGGNAPYNALAAGEHVGFTGGTGVKTGFRTWKGLTTSYQSIPNPMNHNPAQFIYDGHKYIIMSLSKQIATTTSTTLANFALVTGNISTVTGSNALYYMYYHEGLGKHLWGGANCKLWQSTS